ncbi:hypothetical protein DRQ25_17885, partial [Candidatus Fermentibacteria bacterium]
MNTERKKRRISRSGLIVTGILLVVLVIAVADEIYCRGCFSRYDALVNAAIESLNKDELLREFGRPEVDRGNVWVYSWATPLYPARTYLSAILLLRTLESETCAISLRFDETGVVV